MRVPGSSCGWLLAAVALGAQAPPEPASLAGSVTHTLSGAPVARAHVVLRGSGKGAKTYGALTTAEGKFSIGSMVPDTYQASVERVGYFMPAESLGHATVEVVLRAGDKKEDVKFRLAPLGSIAGRVVDAAGEPVEGTGVSIETGPITSTIEATTDDHGRFLLAGLQPGRYRVRAGSSAFLRTAPEIRTDGTTEVRYAPTYFGGVTDFKAATRIAVATGAEVEGIEIRLVRAPMVRISGKVDGVPTGTRASVRYTRIYGMRGDTSAVKKDGTFELWNLEPGNYFLSASWGSGNRVVQTGLINMEVGESNIDNLELWHPAADISGRIVFEDEESRPQGGAHPAKVELRTVDPGLINASPVTSDLAADGSFHLPEVRAARYRVMLSWTSAYVKAVTIGSRQADGNVLNLRAGAGAGAVEVLVSSALGSISGKVADGDDPVAGARIALVRDDFVSLGDVTFTTTDGAGSYSIGSVRPGKYRIAVVEENDEGPRGGNLDNYENYVARVDVQPRDKLSIDLKRQPPVR